MTNVSKFEETARFTVRGTGMFPAGMLSHDHAWPATEIDAARMMHTGQRRVELVVQKLRLITPGRWKSFGWTVVEIDGEEVI